MKRRVLVVGAGSIGLRHLQLLTEVEGLAVEVCDSRPEGLSEAATAVPGARQWSDFREAAASRPDLVFVCTPPASHAPLSRIALESGAHIFCEKPISDSAAGARSMIRDQQRTGRILNVGFVQRFMPEMLRAQKLIREGRIGRVCYARFSVATLNTLANSRSRHQRDVFGSAALDYVYGFDTFWWLMEERPVSVYARGIQVEGLPFTSRPNLLSAVIEYESERVAELHIDYVAYPDRCTYTFQGELGYVQVDLSRNIVEHGDRETGRRHVEKLTVDRDDVMRAQRDHFLDALEGRHPVSSPPQDALHGTLGVDALIRSLKTGQPESLETG